MSAGRPTGVSSWKVESEEAEDDAPPEDEEEAEEEDLYFAKYDAAQDAHLIESRSLEIRGSTTPLSEPTMRRRCTPSKIRKAEDPTAAWKDAVVEGKGLPKKVLFPVRLSHLVNGSTATAARVWVPARYSSTGEVVYPAAPKGLGAR